VTHDPRAAAQAARMVHLDKGVLSPAGADEGDRRPTGVKG